LSRLVLSTEQFRFPLVRGFVRMGTRAVCRYGKESGRARYSKVGKAQTYQNVLSRCNKYRTNKTYRGADMFNVRKWHKVDQFS